jgi:hypothetical protein
MIQRNLKVNQQGTILLLALLIMSGLVVGGFILGSVVVSELRQSRQLDYAIVAYYAAESGAEKLLFDWRETRCTDDCFTNDQLFSNQSCSETSDIGWRCEMSTDQKVTQISFTLAQMQVEQIPLYLPFDPSHRSGAEAMKIFWQDANLQNNREPWLEVSILGWPAATSVNYNNAREIVKRVYKCSQSNINQPYCANITINELRQAYSYIVRIRPLYDDVENVRVKFYKVDNSDNDSDLLDLSNFIKVANFTGIYQGIKQGIRVQFPVVNPSSAMFDFVLFSEESLLKRIF